MCAKRSVQRLCKYTKPQSKWKQLRTVDEEMGLRCMKFLKAIVSLMKEARMNIPLNQQKQTRNIWFININFMQDKHALYFLEFAVKIYN